MRYLFIAEKPSLAQEVQKCYSNHRSQIQKEVGTIDFVALAGHVCRNYMPDEYEEYDWSGRWDAISYPMIPSTWRIRPIDNSGKGKIIRKIKDSISKYDGVIVGTDSDTEGYGIYFLLETYLGMADKHAIRFVEHSLTDSEILSQLLCMTDFHKDPVHRHFTESFLIRSRTDWLYGMNATRIISNKMGVTMNIGRVKAPTIKLIYDNSMAIEQFVPRTYYHLVADYGDFKATQIGQDGKPVEYEKEEDAKRITVPLEGTVVKKDVKESCTHAPQLYDLGAIQTEAGRLYKMSPSEVLDVVQSLYEVHKVISYPRTQCRYVSQEKAKEFPAMLSKMKVFPDLGAFTSHISKTDLERVYRDKKVVNDSEVAKESHDALLPTEVTPKLDKLNENEKRICHLIYARLLAQFLPQLKEEKTKLYLQHGNELFYATGKMVVEEGWRAIYGKPQNIELPYLEKGQKTVAKKISPASRTTTPPKRYTDASIVDAMTNIANLIKDKSLRESLAESKGIGTPATRASIISEIIKAGYVDVKKNQLYITAKGKRLIESFPDNDLFNPEFTAVMDYEMKQIQRGEKDFDSVYDSVLQKLKDMCLQLEQTAVKENLSSFLCPKCRKPFHSLNWGYVCEDCGIKIPFQLGGQKLDDRMIQTILSGEKTKSMSFKKKDGSSFFAALYLDPQEGLKFDFSSGVKCPYCKNDMRHNKAGYFCDCGCKVFSTICGKTLTDGQLKKLITKHSLPEMDGFVSKAGKPFSAALVLEDKSVKLKFN